jgi:hypothetical protein
MNRAVQQDVNKVDKSVYIISDQEMLTFLLS